MSNTRYANFRSFLTERVTVAAVEVFEEVGNIERYYEENKRLRSLIPVTPDPVRKLTRAMPPSNPTQQQPTGRFIQGSLTPVRKVKTTDYPNGSVSKCGISGHLL